MSTESYSILILVSIGFNIINIILAIFLPKDSGFKSGFYLIIAGLILISIIQLKDYNDLMKLAHDEFHEVSVLEIISFISTLILFLIFISLSLTKKIESKKTFSQQPYFYTPEDLNRFTFHPKTENHIKEYSQPQKPEAELTVKTEKEIPVTSQTIETKAPSHIKEVPTNGKPVIAKFIKKEEPRSEEDKLKEELEKLKFQRDKLVSIISHDLRTPLNSVFGYCQLLKDGQFKNKKEVKQFAENIFELSKQQLNALNRIIEWTKYESKDLPLNPTDFDVTSTINFVVKSMSRIAEKKEVKIIVNSKPDLFVFGDEFMIIEVLKNLLDNAIKFSHPQSTIEIHTHYHEKLNKLVVLIIDSGVGIDREILMNLLVSTKKFTSRGTKGEKGLGLGLLIVKSIIDKHGEHLWIASEEGKWTRVYFTLKPSEKLKSKL